MFKTLAKVVSRFTWKLLIDSLKRLWIRDQIFLTSALNTQKLWLLLIFSYCLAGEEALVCDDEDEVVHVKAQQVPLLGG